MWDGPGSEQYGELTRRSMAVVDENQVRFGVRFLSWWQSGLKVRPTSIPSVKINYEALVELMCLLADEQQRQGASAFLSDWPEAAKYLQVSGCCSIRSIKIACYCLSQCQKLPNSPTICLPQKKQSAPGGAVLVFLPGAPEISRLQRALQASDKLAAAAGGRQKLRILPLHGSLSSSDQTRVFGRCSIFLASPVILVYTVSLIPFVR